MSVITDLYNTLNTASGVRTYVGIASSPQESRIYPGAAPESAVKPYIDFSVVTRSPLSTITGVNDAHHYTVRIAAHSLDFDEAENIADAVHAALEGDGYQEERYEFYDEETKTFGCNIEWAFIA